MAYNFMLIYSRLITITPIELALCTLLHTAYASQWHRELYLFLPSPLALPRTHSLLLSQIFLRAVSNL